MLLLLCVPGSASCAASCAAAVECCWQRLAHARTKVHARTCRDDLAWAATWLYRETGDKAYLSDAYAFYTMHQDLEGTFDIRYLVGAWLCLITHLQASQRTAAPLSCLQARARLCTWRARTAIPYPALEGAQLACRECI